MPDYMDTKDFQAGARSPASASSPFWSAPRAAVALLDLFHLWRLRARERRDLMAVSDRVLKDIGITRGQAAEEWRKPFWRP